MTKPSSVHGVKTTFFAWQGLLIVLFILIIFSESQAASVPERNLVVGTKEAPPFAMKLPNGNWTGISIDLWRAIADVLQLDSLARSSLSGWRGLLDGKLPERLSLLFAGGRENLS